MTAPAVWRLGEAMGVVRLSLIYLKLQRPDLAKEALEQLMKELEAAK